MSAAVLVTVQGLDPGDVRVRDLSSGGRTGLVSVVIGSDDAHVDLLDHRAKVRATLAAAIAQLDALDAQTPEAGE